jgi:hypothetical protein
MSILKRRKLPEVTLGELTLDELLEPVDHIIETFYLEKGGNYKHKVTYLDGVTQIGYLRYDGPLQVVRPGGEIQTIPQYLDYLRVFREGLCKEVVRI